MLDNFYKYVTTDTANIGIMARQIHKTPEELQVRVVKGDKTT